MMSVSCASERSAISAVVEVVPLLNVGSERSEVDAGRVVEEVVEE